MHRKVKVLIARWLASRLETRARRLRRALRDNQRAELRRIRATDRRARGLRLYAAWTCKEREPTNFRTVVPLQKQHKLKSYYGRNPHGSSSAAMPREAHLWSTQWSRHEDFTDHRDQKAAEKPIVIAGSRVSPVRWRESGFGIAIHGIRKQLILKQL